MNDEHIHKKKVFHLVGVKTASVGHIYLFVIRFSTCIVDECLYSVRKHRFLMIIVDILHCRR